jgi:hypothetical protein
MVVEDDFIRELGLDPEDEAWVQIARDAARCRNATWFALAFCRLKAC